MQKYKKAAASIAFLTLLLTAGISTGYASAKKENDDKSDQASQEAILDTFEDGDYDSWKKLVAKKSRIDNVVEEADFQEFIAARTAIRSGNYDQAVAIAEDLESRLKSKLVNDYLS